MKSLYKGVRMQTQPKVTVSRLAEAIVELADLDHEIQQAELHVESLRHSYTKKKHLLFELGYASTQVNPKPPTLTGSQAVEKGTIKKVVGDRGFGFIAGEGGDYFFHLTDLHNIPFEQLREGMACTFIVKRHGTALEAGACMEVFVTK